MASTKTTLKFREGFSVNIWSIKSLFLMTVLVLMTILVYMIKIALEYIHESLANVPSINMVICT